MTINILRILILLVLSHLTLAQKVLKSSPPDWITPIDPQITTSFQSSQVSNGYLYTLVDRQFDLSSQTEFGHYTRKIFNKDGVQNASEISVSYDPSYQKLVFHNISIYRNGVKINKLNAAKIQVIQKEQDQDRYLYDGSLTAFVVLDDIRVGDVVDYSFSRIGFNPIYKSKFFNSFTLQFGDPLDRIFIRIQSPSERKLNFKAENGSLVPKVETLGTKTNYIIDLKKIKGLSTEDYLPSWFDPYHSISVSEHNSWDEFSDWISKIYTTVSSTVDLKRRIDPLISGLQNKEEIALRLIRFVQNEIRYTGFEGGISGYVPHAPLKVFDQRFGDCKDKSWLLVHLLKVAEVEAYPVLVNTESKDQVKKWLPSAYAFNHCVVKLVINNKTIWIDPTISHQGGDLFTTYFPDYKTGFVIKGKESGFENIARSEGDKTEVREIVHLDEVGGGGSLEIESSYYGSDADYQRGYFYSTPIDDIQKSYLNFYANNFTEIDTLKLVSFEDDTIKNVFKTFEKYLIKDLWQKSENDTSVLIASFFARSLNDRIRIPSNKNRKMPMALYFPYEYHQETEIHLPEPWTINEDSKKISNENFTYSEVNKYNDEICYLIYDYKTSKDVVEVSEFKQYIKDVNKITGGLTFQFTYNLNQVSENKASGRWVMYCFYLFGCSIAIFLCYRLLFYNPDSKTLDNDYVYESIGGWLVLVGIAMVVSPIRLLIDMGQLSYFDPNLWGGVSYSSSIGIIFLIEAIFNLFSFFCYVLLAYLFFNKRTSFPQIFIISMVASLVFHLLDFFVMTKILEVARQDEDARSLIHTIIYTAIWLPYMLYSERVKGTFVETL